MSCSGYINRIIFLFSKFNISGNFIFCKNIINTKKCKVAIKKAELLIRNHGRMLVRKSGTEPKIRIMGESKNKVLLNKCIKIISERIN